jgi:capsule polysaccharide export protein KpsE/RkpR
LKSLLSLFKLHRATRILGKMEEIQGLSGNANVKGSFLDVLVTVAENGRLLVLGSLAAGLCALGIGFVLPQAYQSVAVLQGDPSHASLMLTAAVLDPVIASLGLARDATPEEARIKLRNQIKASVGRTDKLLTLTVSARSPQQAQAIAAAVLQRTYQEARPKGTARLRLEAQLAEAKVRLKNAQDVGQSLYRQLDGAGTGANARAEVARGYAELLSATGAAQNQIGLIEAQLEGLSEAQLIQAPTLPERASQPRKGLMALGATLAAGLALLLFVFVRQSLRETLVSQSTSGKWLRIRKSLGLG